MPILPYRFTTLGGPTAIFITFHEVESFFGSELTDNSRDRDLYGKLGKAGE